MNLSLISKNIRKYPLLFVCALIVPLALVLLTMRGPKVNDYQDQLTRLEREWKEIQTNMERSYGLDADISNLNEGLAAIEGRLMNVEEVAANYEFFYDLERRSGVTVDRFSLGLPFEGEGLPLGKPKLRHFSVVPCDVVMNGSIQEMLRFLDLLDRQDFIIRMDLLSVVQATDKKGLPDSLTARLRCHVLSAKND
jgi:hypothetical protein